MTLPANKQENKYDEIFLLYNEFSYHISIEVCSLFWTREILHGNRQMEYDPWFFTN